MRGLMFMLVVNDNQFTIDLVPNPGSDDDIGM